MTASRPNRRQETYEPWCGERRQRKKTFSSTAVGFRTEIKCHQRRWRPFSPFVQDLLVSLQPSQAATFNSSIGTPPSVKPVKGVQHRQSMVATEHSSLPVPHLAIDSSTLASELERIRAGIFAHFREWVKRFPWQFNAQQHFASWLHRTCTWCPAMGEVLSRCSFVCFVVCPLYHAELSSGILPLLHTSKRPAHRLFIKAGPMQCVHP